ncbi:MAG: M48 family metallopeptidase [Proteobacteria bacterium]|nr:M48 family metallopeptidase [Pseudomonadota bacterium]
MRLSFLPAAFAFACALLAGNPARAVTTKLPDMGSSAGAIASPEEQRQYGFYVLHELRNQGMVLDDALLTDYINTLGYRLVSYSPQPDQPFTFFVVNDPSINAFALPGGFVGVNAGLITTTASEDELAAVLAHEISHVTQQHLVRAVEAEQKYAPLMILAMVGAIVASSRTSPGSTSNADVGAMATATGLMQQMQINFTRADEEEADRVGIETLAKANFDPDAMAGFFQRMQRALRPGFDENDVPALLMDHPVTLQRISEAKARAETLKKQMQATVDVGEVSADGSVKKVASSSERVSVPTRSPTRSTATPAPTLPPFLHNSIAALNELMQPNGDRHQQRARSEAYYELMRERVRVLASTQPARTAAYYADNLKNTPGFDTLYNRYGYALALERSGEAKKAVPIADKLAAEHPDHLVLQIAAGHAQAMAGARDDALKRFSALEKDYPDNRALVLAHAQALLQVNDLASARLAQKILRPQLSIDDEDPDLQTTFARACELAGDHVRAGEAHAAAAYLNGRAEDALNQLKDLTKRSDLDYYQRARIEALIAQITPVVLELRRRKISPSDQGKLALQPN